LCRPVFRKMKLHMIQSICDTMWNVVAWPSGPRFMTHRETAALRNINIRETMFLFNQRLLPTRVRCHRIYNITDTTCALCKQALESNEHIMLHCPSRVISTRWLERTLRSHGCRTTPMEFSRGQLGPVTNRITSFALVAAYVYTTWKERKADKPPHLYRF
jgi:hypothetical protein